MSPSVHDELLEDFLCDEADHERELAAERLERLERLERSDDLRPAGSSWFGQPTFKASPGVFGEGRGDIRPELSTDVPSQPALSPAEASSVGRASQPGDGSTKDEAA